MNDIPLSEVHEVRAVVRRRPTPIQALVRREDTGALELLLVPDELSSRLTTDTPVMLAVDTTGVVTDWRPTLHRSRV